MASNDIYGSRARELNTNHKISQNEGLIQNNNTTEELNPKSKIRQNNNTTEIEINPLPKINSNDIYSIFKKQNLTISSIIFVIIHIILIIPNWIIIPIILSLNGCNNTSIEHILYLIMVCQIIYYASIILKKFYFSQDRIQIQKCLFSIIILISILSYLLFSFILGVEIFDTNEYCNKRFHAFVIIIAVINCIWYSCLTFLISFGPTFKRDPFGIITLLRIHFRNY